MIFLVAITVVAEIADIAGVFDVAGHWAARLGRHRTPLLWLLLVLLSCLATIVLSLDTTAVLLTPVVIAVARQLGLSAVPFVMTTVWLANTASLLLPVSNLTNLLALHHFSLLGLGTAGYLRLALWPAVASIAASVVVLAVLHRRSLRGRYELDAPPEPHDRVLLVVAGAVCVALGPAFVSGVTPAIPADHRRGGARRGAGCRGACGRCAGSRCRGWWSSGSARCSSSWTSPDGTGCNALLDRLGGRRHLRGGPAAAQRHRRGVGQRGQQPARLPGARAGRQRRPPAADGPADRGELRAPGDHLGVAGDDPVARAVPQGRRVGLRPSPSPGRVRSAPPRRSVPPWRRSPGSTPDPHCRLRRPDAPGCTPPATGRTGLPESGHRTVEFGRYGASGPVVRACWRSSTRSRTSSSPTEIRTHAVGDADRRAAPPGPSRRCVVVAGWVIRDLASPRLLEMSMICSAFSSAKAASLPPSDARR